ncbi:alpha/beta hydrolase [Providencia rettgeri]
MINSKMNYIDIGKGFPLLLGHSYLFDKHMWSEQIFELSKYYRIIAPDLWGHGLSPELPEFSEDLTDIAHDHLDLMNTLGIKEFGIIGISVGGMWGAQLAALYPHRVKLLVLIGTYLGSEPEIQRQKYYALLDEINKSGLITNSILQYIIRQFYSNDAPNPLILKLMDDLKKIGKDRLCESIVPLGKMIFGRKDNLFLLTKIKAPSLIITGELDKPRPPLEGNEMAAILKCEHIIVPKSGHILPKEKPKLMTSILLDFLNKSGL